MYQPPHFAETRVPVMHALMRSHPFALLVTLQDGVIAADHVPIAIDETASDLGTLRAHVARANPIVRNCAEGSDVLAVFQGPQAYVTPSWYPSKREHGKVVPTWNYAVVHACGAIRFHDDPVWLRRQLDMLTTRQEAPRSEPWSIDDAPDDFMQRQMRGIVGIEIEIVSLDGKWKMSQNKDAADRVGVRDGLTGEADADAVAVAALVVERSS
jgi:transcriptional regulator